jgi:pyroglutamyl-peptidase
VTTKKILLTGFEPYGGRGLNPSAEIVKQLQDQEINGVPIAGRILPVTFQNIEHHVRQALDETDPIAVVSLGLWPGSPLIKLERIGINVAHCDIPDNAGERLLDIPLAETGPAALFSTLPLRAIEQRLLEAGIPVQMSNSAGTFLCNAVLYNFLKLIADTGNNIPCGFIHLPYLPSQVAGMLTEARQGSKTVELHMRADLASLDLATMTAAVRIALDSVLTGATS